MHHLTLTPRTLISISSPNASFPPNFSPFSPSFPSNSSSTYKYSALNCRAIDVSVLNNSLNSRGHNKGSSRGYEVPEKLKSSGVKDVDITTLGNLCVDIVLNVPNLPPQPKLQRKAFMEQLASSPPDKKFWEAGGHCNTAIAAARLGLRCVAIGHVGDETYGHFLHDVLREERIGFVEMVDVPDASRDASEAYETLLCWVLVDPLHRHGFCSRADFTDEPAFHWIHALTWNVKAAIKQSKILVFNGYGFDDLSPGFIMSAVNYAVEVGTSVFFDPGPKGKSLSMGTPAEKMAFNELLKMSDVLLLTFDEAESLTGIGNPILAGQELLKRGIRTKWVIIKLGNKGSVLISWSGTFCAPSFEVNAVDTVGCGDSFVAAVAYGFVHELPKTHTLAIANAVGAATAMGSGAGRNVASFWETLELIKSGDVNEDDKFWSEILDEIIETPEISLLSKKVVNKAGERLKCVPLERVMTELASKLESSKVEAEPSLPT